MQVVVLNPLNAWTHFLHQDSILQLQRGQHRSGWDPAGFEHIPPQQQGKNGPENQAAPEAFVLISVGRRRGIGHR